MIVCLLYISNSPFPRTSRQSSHRCRCSGRVQRCSYVKHFSFHTPRGNSPPPFISMGEGRQRGGGKSGCCRAAEFALPLLTFTLSARTELNEATLTLWNVSSGDFFYLGLHEILHPLNYLKNIYIYIFFSSEGQPESRRAYGQLPKQPEQPPCARPCLVV